MRSGLQTAFAEIGLVGGAVLLSRSPTGRPGLNDKGSTMATDAVPVDKMTHWSYVPGSAMSTDAVPLELQRSFLDDL